MKTSPIFKIISIGVLVAAVLYFGVLIEQYVSNPLVTTYAYLSEAEDSIEVNGWVIRDEQAVANSSGVLSPTRSEGEKVSKGGEIAVAYASQDSLAIVAQIEELNAKLEQLEYAQETFLDTDSALKIDSSINDAIIELKQSTSENDYSEAYELASNLKSLVVKRDYTQYTSSDQILSDMEEVKAQITALQGQLGNAVSVTVDRSGIYSSKIDGYESVLTLDFLTDLTPEKLENIQAGEITGNAGKMIYGNTWYYATILDIDDVGSLSVGTKVTLRFTKGLTQDFTVRVYSMSEAVDGQIAVVFYSNKYISELTQLRHQSAEIIFKTYEGIHIPGTALRMKDGETGVYCVVGASAKFKPVEIIYQDEGYVLVEAKNGASELRTLRSGDEVIITSGEITDGDVVNSQ